MQPAKRTLLHSTEKMHRRSTIDLPSYDTLADEFQDTKPLTRSPSTPMDNRSGTFNLKEQMRLNTGL